MRALVAIAFALLTGSVQAQNPDPDVLFKDVSSKPGARVIQEPQVTRVEVPSERTLYFFTDTGHFAHRSVVIRKVEEKDGTVGVRTQGFTTRSKAMFDRWIAAFLEQDAQRRRELEKKGQAQ